MQSCRCPLIISSLIVYCSLIGPSRSSGDFMLCLLISDWSNHFCTVDCLRWKGLHPPIGWACISSLCLLFSDWSNHLCSWINFVPWFLNSPAILSACFHSCKDYLNLIGWAQVLSHFWLVDIVIYAFLGSILFSIWLMQPCYNFSSLWYLFTFLKIVLFLKTGITKNYFI